MSPKNVVKKILAVDLGGTKIAAALITREGHILGHKQEPTCQRGPNEGTTQILRLLRALMHEHDLGIEEVSCVGVGIPAVLEPKTDLVLWAPNLKGWREVALRPALEQELGVPVFIEYDGHAAVLGEWWRGEGRGYQSLVNVIIGTGIGGGMILEGKLVRGRDRLAGAAGWFALTSEVDQQEQNARELGFWEALSAGPAIARQAQAQLASHPESLLGKINNKKEPLTAAHVFQAASQGDTLAEQVVDQLADRLGLGIANIVSLVNPEIVILGGGVGSQCSALIPRIQQVVEQWAQPISARSVKITTSQLGGNAGILGAAYSALLRQEEEYDI